MPSYSKFLIESLDRISQLEGFVAVELCNLKYEPSRAACIDPHFDDFWLWGDRLITFNLMSNTILTLTPGPEIEKKFEDCQIFLPLARRCVIVLFSDARNKWLHSIKRSHIKSTRLAITLRELSDEFKFEEKHKIAKKIIEKISLTFRGVSVGTIEEFFKNDFILKEKFDQHEEIFYQGEIDFKNFDYLTKESQNLTGDSINFNNQELLKEIGKIIAITSNKLKEVKIKINLNLKKFN